ncbi:MAG TPA: hypothetical protein DCP31_24480 [Cyanobacteria bacterium UBA8543]|nr:hypothetical protein [Cyanobacteria bacterium UBA8543]
MSILYRQISLAELSTRARSHRRHWQLGIEVAMVTHQKVPLGFIVPLEIFNSLPTESVAGMPLKELQPWLFQNRQGWLDGIMDGLTLTWHGEEVMAFAHPSHQVRLPLLRKN